MVMFKNEMSFEHELEKQIKQETKYNTRGFVNAVLL